MPSLDDSDRWKTSLLNFGLIAPHNTKKSLEKTYAAKHPNIYFGTGVATPKAVSQGLPFDFMGMLLCAEWTRRQVDASGIVHEISDTHALESGSHDPEQVVQIASMQKEQVTHLAEALGIPNYQCVLASDYRGQGAFKAIQAEIDGLCPPDMPVYVRYQSAGNAFISRKMSAGYKVGWLRDDNDKIEGLDERYFNKAYDDLDLKERLCFVYTWCGRTFDSVRPFVSPYTFLTDEKRLSLTHTGNAEGELKNLLANCSNLKINRGVIAHLTRIVTAYDTLFGSLDIGSLWQKAGTQASKDGRCIDILDPGSKCGAQIGVEVKSLARQIDIIRRIQAPRNRPQTLNA